VSHSECPLPLCRRYESVSGQAQQLKRERKNIRKVCTLRTLKSPCKALGPTQPAPLHPTQPPTQPHSSFPSRPSCERRQRRAGPWSMS